MKTKNFSKMIALVLALTIAIMAFGLTPSVFAKIGPVAEVDGEQYTEFVDALNAARDVGGKTIKLLADVEDPTYYGARKGFTLDLNGFNLTVAGFQIKDSHVSIIGSGTVYTTLQQPFCLVGSTTETENYSTLSVGKDVTLHSKYTEGTWYEIVHNWSSPFNDVYGVVVDFNGKIEGESGVEGVGLYVSGNYKETNDKFTIGSSAVINCAYGIYAAGDADWTVSGTINAVNSGIEIRAGELNINGGSITATYIPTEVTPNGNGTTTDGAAVAVAQHTTKLPIDVKISGGKFKAYTPFIQTNPQNNSAEDVAKVKIKITGGEFKKLSNEQHNSVFSENFTGFISGGTYEIPVNEGEGGYIADGYDQYQNVDGSTTVLPVCTATFDKVSAMEVGTTHDLNLKVSVEAAKKYYGFSVAEGEDIVKIEDGKMVALKPGKAEVVFYGSRLGEFFEVVVCDVAPNDEASEVDKEASQILLDAIQEAASSEEEVTGLLGTTAEEMEKIADAIENGKTLTTEVVAETIEEAPEADVKLIAKEIDGKEKLVGYYDISVLVKANGEEIAKLRELGKKIKVELPVSKDLPKVAEGYQRTYSVIRVHEGVAEVIAEGIEAVDGKIPVETDKFSTYAVTYTDKVATNPKTGDSIMIAVAVFALTTLAFVIIKKNK